MSASPSGAACEPGDSREPGWPAYKAFIYSWIVPAKTARRTQHVPLWKAFLIHLCSLPCVFLGWILGGVLGSGSWQPAEEFAEDLPEILGPDPFELLLLLLLAVAGLQLNLVIPLAGLLTPWGAADEPFRDSFRHALRRVWMQTPHLAVLFFIISFGSEVIEHLVLGRYHTHGDYWTWAQRDMLLLLLVLAAFAWGLWALLQALGAPRQVVAVKRPPVCEVCGYNLTLADLQGRCPECGEAVVTSLGEGVRPGVPWQHRDQAGWWRSYWRTAGLALFHPSRLGRVVQADAPAGDHRLFLVISLLLTALISYAISIAVVAMQGKEPLDFNDRWTLQLVTFHIPLLSVLLTAASLAVVCCLAGLSAWRVRNEYRRNLMPAAMQIVSYQSLLWPIGVVWGGLWFIVLSELTETAFVNALAVRWNIPAGLTVTLGFVFVIILFMGWVETMILRGIRALRFANR